MNVVWDFFTGDAILSADQLDRIADHKYKREGWSYLDSTFDWFWRWLESKYPRRLAPNCITMTGLAANILGLTVLAYYSPDAKQEAPSYAYFFCAFCIFIYNTTDATDGIHARNTGTISPLGELFDHGGDSVSQVLLCMILCISIQLGVNTDHVLVFYILASTVFYCAHWRTYTTGIMRFNQFDANEGEMCIILFLCLTGCFGAKLWSKEFCHVPLRHCVTTFSVSVVLIDTCLYARKVISTGFEKGFVYIAGPFTHILTILVPPIWIYRVAATNVLGEHMVVFCLACGTISTKRSVQIMVAKMSGDGFRAWDTILWAPVAVLLNYYFNTPIPERICLYLFLIYGCTNVFCYFWVLADQICSRMNIRCFRLP